MSMEEKYQEAIQILKKARKDLKEIDKTLTEMEKGLFSVSQKENFEIKGINHSLH